MLGDGSFADVPEFAAEVAALPRHPRDDDYGFVRDALLGEGFRPGPYPIMEPFFDDSSEDEDGEGEGDEEDYL